MESTAWLFVIIGAAVGYLLGSVSSAVVVCKMMGLPDPRTQGSGNPGATNVLRVGGKKAAALTLAGDLLKGLLAVLIIRWLFPLNELAWLAAGMGAFLGHMFPVFFGFKGGKGVATALGVLLVWDWRVALIVLGIWLTVFAITRVSSLSALIAAFCAPWLAFLMIDNIKLPMMILAMVAILIYRHKDNIRRLRSGEESAFKKR
ncbi:glycerol-3-phosphate 1-O-acyltransferase PlsY [Suttonella ornithocola]|uniref:Glycerol-3-phosphate acyltransferase n=1 Tax=Suttonella ornithocola TaxID=279832 RepID=A0A380MZN4_9GAMM|nr:glycerol-3-phosphate 1-O-acyltransferase PlsY [Suttonella ornithocola]SUO97684.1 G3P acyltransferase [Suttonella ornithocola]